MDDLLAKLKGAKNYFDAKSKKVIKEASSLENITLDSF